MNVAVVNESTVVTDAEVSEVVEALQIQATRDFAQVWDIEAAVVFKGKDDVPAGFCQLIVLDNSDQAGALGYHDLTEEGLPIGKVFAGTDKQYGNSWSVTISHELLELLADPDINLCAQYGDRLYAYEVCDPVEDDSLGYEINGVLVSDFVSPAWFSASAPGPFDFKGVLTHAFQLAEGGYISVLDFADGQGWKQINNYAESMAHQKRAPIGSRRERRRVSAFECLNKSVKPCKGETK